MNYKLIIDDLQGLSFYDAFKHIMRAYGFSCKKLADTSLISEETISRYRNGRAKPSKATLVQLCFGMKLPYEVSDELLKKGGIYIHTSFNDDVVYSVLLEQSRVLSIYDANEIIIDANKHKCFDEKEIPLFKVQQ